MSSLFEIYVSVIMQLKGCLYRKFILREKESDEAFKKIKEMEDIALIKENIIRNKSMNSQDEIEDKGEKNEKTNTS